MSTGRRKSIDQLAARLRCAHALRASPDETLRSLAEFYFDWLAGSAGGAEPQILERGWQRVRARNLYFNLAVCALPGETVEQKLAAFERPVRRFLARWPALREGTAEPDGEVEVHLMTARRFGSIPKTRRQWARIIADTAAAEVLDKISAEMSSAQCHPDHKGGRAYGSVQREGSSSGGVRRRR